MKRIFLFALILSFMSQVFATVYENKIYDSKVQTILFGKAGTEDRYPIVSINSAEQLKLSFDILLSTSENLQYTLVHCDANWNPTRLNQNEYLSGMTFDNIQDFKFSTNTYVKYVHYNVLLPNDNMKPRIAGNYIVKVYRNFDEEELLFTRRMMVLNNSATIEGLARPATLAEHRYTKQELQFTVGINPSTVVNPLQDVSVVLMQNSRWDNAITGLKPQFMSNNKLEYNYLDQTLFNGGNEFRFFDIRQLRQFSQNVRSKRTDTVVHVILNIDESRGAMQYFNYFDYNGKRLVQNKEGNNSEIDGDYAYVNFYLSSVMGVPPDAEVYVFGEFTDWRLVPEYKMYYNKNRMRYDLEVPLKQGRYEYCYAIKNEKGQPDETVLEGNHFQTENEYLVLVYAKNLQYHYDELIGVRKFSTQTQ
ncbi:MAG: DUF5103 domain-containing protein [Bacteroidia bacterium]|nr:DUF5103 domain-containing protein [Bacteroidia bacterium]